MNSNLNAAQFKDEKAAYAYVEAWLWPTGPVCPGSGSAKKRRLSATNSAICGGALKSVKIAPSGQTGSQAPQSMHSLGLI